MNTEEDFASDSDQSDDDFCPDAVQSEPGSEEESEDISAEEDNGENQVPLKAVKKKNTVNKRTKLTKAKKKATNGDDDNEEKEVTDGTANKQHRRQTRQTDENNGKSVGKAIEEKDEIETDEEADKSHSDALWADFLSDVKQPTIAKKVQTINATNPTVSSCKPNVNNSPQTNGNKAKEEKVEEKPLESKTIVVTEIVDFAGEAVSIQKTLPVESVKENKMVGKKPPISPLIAAQKRPASSGSGLGSILNQIGKKKKISVLEKTKLDWNSFKHDEGIEEQLQTHNKGKDGYLEKQDFLQRTDLRQFEIEKSLRQTRRTQ